MILSKNFSIRAAVLLFAIQLCFSIAAAQNDAAVAVQPHEGAERLKIAVFPVFNLSGSPAPLVAIGSRLIEDLEDAHATLIESDVLDSAIVKYRVRYLGGLDEATAQALRQETGADAF